MLLLLAVRIFNLFLPPVLLTTNATPVLFYRYTILCDVKQHDWLIGLRFFDTYDRLISKVEMSKNAGEKVDASSHFPQNGEATCCRIGWNNAKSFLKITFP